jgi:UDP-N-acetylmuramate: L-alanyl-gamma-D-glutamyl-meso-diaminopimelate ligase
MHIHVLGIGGTFMAGMARLAVALGHRVTGADQALYPPMSTQLESLGIEITEGYDPAGLVVKPDLTVIGNALSRGNPAVEYLLDQDLPYMSGPQWLQQNVLPERHVIAISGTHGKTSVTSLVTWMLECAGLDPGFLVGGVLENFGFSARLGTGPFFVIEADEYDTAFFDKRSKFIHYRPRTLVINNLEFDHADIFPDIAAIQRQFHHLVRTLPGCARIIRPQPDHLIDEVIGLGCWSKLSTFGMRDDCDWQFNWQDGAARRISISAPGSAAVTAPTPLMGEHNAWNVTAAVSAVTDAGVDIATALQALGTFANVRRRLELRGEHAGIRMYDDFAHHPTAISATIAALRGTHQQGRIIALLELRSNSMVMGIHENTLLPALDAADIVAIMAPNDLNWDVRAALAGHAHAKVFTDADELVGHILSLAILGDNILAMSNGAFANVHEKILARLRSS